MIENVINYCLVGIWIVVLFEWCKEGYVVIVVDNGFGIDESECEKVFWWFYWFDKSWNLLGNGFGLSMVKVIVDFYGFSVKIEDNWLGVCFVLS